MGRSRTQNSIRNIMFGVISRMVSVLFPFLIRTIFIEVLGEEYLGLNSLYKSVLQVLNLTDLGFASAIIANMYKPIAEGDVYKISALMNLYKKIYRFIGFVILIVGVLLTPFIEKLINGKPPEDINIYILWMLYLTNTVVSYLFFAYKVSLINAHQRNDITERIGIVCGTIISVLQIVSVILYKNVYLYVLLTIINSVAYNLWCSKECDQRFPQYKCSGNLDRTTKKEISKNISALAFQKIGNTISLSLDSIIISAVLGLRVVAIYGNYYYVVSAVSAFVNLIYSAIVASVGNSIVSETLKKNLRDIHKFSFLNTWLIGWCSICFMCIFQDFMIIWMGKDLLFGVGTVLLLVLRFYFEQIRKIVLTYKDAAGMWWTDKWRPLIGCLMNLTLNLILVNYIGVAGVMLSTIISYVFIEIPWETHALFKNYFKGGELKYYIELLRTSFSILFAGIATYYICLKIYVDHILAVIIKLCICIVIPNLLFILLNLNNQELKNSKKFVEQIFVSLTGKN